MDYIFETLARLPFEKEIISNYDPEGIPYAVDENPNPVVFDGHPNLTNNGMIASITSRVMCGSVIASVLETAQKIKAHDFHSPCDTACKGTGLTYISYG